MRTQDTDLVLLLPRIPLGLDRGNLSLKVLRLDVGLTQPEGEDEVLH